MSASSRPLTLGLLVLGLVGAPGCGSGGSPSPGDRFVGVATPEYPAPHPPLPQVVSLRGPVVAAPNLVAITFQGDPLGAGIASFVSQLAASKYWTQATAEYGAGLLSASPPLQLSEQPPATLTDTEVQAWLASKVMSLPGFPQPGLGTIYALFYPDTTTITTGTGMACRDFGGYHSDFELPTGEFVTYLVIPRCPAPSVGALDSLTAATSHEMVEIATDPLPQDRPAWGRLDADHRSWELQGGEIGDVCAGLPGAWVRPPGVDNLVQRVWSNKAAAADRDPCEPMGVTPYFNSAPVLVDTVLVTDALGNTFATLGASIAVGQKKTIELDLFSDAPTSGPWTVSAIDATSAFGGGDPVLSFSFDRNRGRNGDKLHLTITAMNQMSNRTAPFWIQNDLGGAKTIWMGVVAN